jgi:hypothetical protein
MPDVARMGGRPEPVRADVTRAGRGSLRTKIGAGSTPAGLQALSAPMKKATLARAARDIPYSPARAQTSARATCSADCAPKGLEKSGAHGATDAASSSSPSSRLSTRSACVSELASRFCLQCCTRFARSPDSGARDATTVAPCPTPAARWRLVFNASGGPSRSHGRFARCFQ